MSYDDPRLAAIYDLDTPSGPDHEFLRALADTERARRIIDLGCGTGILTVTLAREDRVVIGVDPARAMLERAASRDGSEQVAWVLGDSSVLVPASADLIIMTGNVSMHIIGADWPKALADIANALLPGGRLVFDNRNPAAKAWAAWNEPLQERMTPVGRLRESLVTDPPDSEGVALLHWFNEFVDTGEVLPIDQPLQFRDLKQIRNDLTSAGLVIENVWGDWVSTPFTGAEPMMIVEAVRPNG